MRKETIKKNGNRILIRNDYKTERTKRTANLLSSTCYRFLKITRTIALRERYPMHIKKPLLRGSGTGAEEPV